MAAQSKMETRASRTGRSGERRKAGCLGMLPLNAQSLVLGAHCVYRGRLCFWRGNTYNEIITSYKKFISSWLLLRSRRGGGEAGRGKVAFIDCGRVA